MVFETTAKASLTRAGGIFVFLVGLASVLPILIVGLEAASTNRGQTIWNDALGTLYETRGAIFNSTFYAIICGSLGTCLAWLLTLKLTQRRLLIALLLITLFFPGSISAKGFEYAVHDWFSDNEDLGRFLSLVIGLSGYIFPYQVLIAIDAYDNISSEEICAVSELTDRATCICYWLNRLKWPSTGMFLVGSALVVTEVPRSKALTVDLFNVGTQTTGPWFVDKFQSTGLSGSLFTTTSLFLVVFTLLLYYDPLRRRRSN